MSLLVSMPAKACSTTRIREVVGPERPELGLSHIYLGFVGLGRGERRGFDFGPLDTIAVVMAGSVEAAWEDGLGRTHREIVEGPDDVFDGPPRAICVRPYTTLFVTGLSTSVEVALIRAELVAESAAAWHRGEAETEAEDDAERLPEPGAELAATRGGLAGARTTIRLIAHVERAAVRLLVGWALIGAGSADRIVSAGADLTREEVWHFRTRPELGAVHQRVYSPLHNRDEIHLVRHGDTVAIPPGFGAETPATGASPVTAPAPDCDVYCLWAQAQAQAGGVSTLLGDRRRGLPQ